MAEQSDLIDFIASVSGEGKLRVEENLGEGFVRLRVAEAERRQAKHDIRSVEDIVIEMLRNARDAGAAHIYVASAKSGNQRILVLIDDGSGVPEDMQQRIFEPRVTSKLETMVMDRWGVHGRGMALYSVSQNTRQALVKTSGKNLGSSFYVEVNTDELVEKTDQSTWPHLGKDDEGNPCITKGPHNIIRTILEFSLESEGKTEVFYGTPTEIASTLHAQAKEGVSPQTLLFLHDVTDLRVVDRLGAAADAQDFLAIASTLGLDLSERTAHRILSGRIKSLRPALSILRRERKNREAAGKVDIYRDSRGLKVDKKDLEEFSRDLERTFQSFAEKYFVSLADVPKVRVEKDKIHVTFPIDKDA